LSAAGKRADSIAARLAQKVVKPLVADGAYAKASFLKPVLGLGVTVVRRLRKDSALWTVPGPRRRGQRGRTRKYGDQRIGLSHRAGQKRGWTTAEMTLYGKKTTKRYKPFEATWRPVGGAIRVVLVDEETGWRAYFCTDTKATPEDILTQVASRFSIETAFRDVKEVVGAGQQQVQFIWANIGSFNMCLWTFVLTEGWAWTATEGELVSHRSASPWDDDPRRPSHADQRRAWRRKMLGNQFHAVMRAGLNEREIERAIDSLLDLAI
jgi:hypothetical protein